MSIKKETPSEQNSLPARELQKFFNKVEGVLLIPKGSKMQLMENAVVCLAVSKETYISFTDYGINKHIVNLLDNKFPILEINAPDDSKFAIMSIKDKDSGLTFKLPDQPIGHALLNFVEVTKYDEKIPLMIGFFNDGNLAFESNIKSNVLLVLDGYIFE